MNRRWLPWIAALGCCGLFLALGFAFLRYTGVQYDEALFVAAIYTPEQVEYFVTTPLGKVPLMLMTYIGTLKAAIYAPILKWFGSNYGTLRLPMLAAAAGGIWFFFLLARRMTNAWIAVLVTLLLSTDAIYLLTSLYDWGPVALQHLLFCTALYCGYRHFTEGGSRWLFLAALATGLALWDKAIVAWLLAGFGAAAVLVWPRETGQMLRSRRAPIALAGFVLGAAPFLVYNVAKPLETFRANMQDTKEDLALKVASIDRSLDGEGLFDYIVRDASPGPPQGMRWWERIPLWISQHTGGQRKSLQHLLLAAAILAAPLLWFTSSRKPALFFFLGGMISWLLMIRMHKAGGSQHHTILLWPVPHIMLSLALAELAVRKPGRVMRAAAAAVLICVLSNGLVLNQYLAQFIANGPTDIWTNAIRPLMVEIGKRPNRLLYFADWGIMHPVEFFGGGKIGFHRPSDGVLVTFHEPLSRAYLDETLANPINLYLTHTEGHESYPGVRKRLVEYAASKGLRDDIVATVADRHGVAIFEVHEFRR